VEVAWRLGEICDPSSKIIAALKEALGDQELSVRGAAAEALGRIGCLAAEAVPPILEFLDRETDEMGRARCVFALGRAGSNAAQAVPVLLELLRCDNTHAYDTALWALAEIGIYTPEVTEEISKGLDRELSDQRWVAAKALGLIGSAASRAVPRLAASLADVHPLIRELSAWALGEIGSAADSAVPSLLTLADTDPCPEIRCRAIVSAGLISGGSLHAAPEVSKSGQTGAAGDPGMGRRAIEHLGRIRNQDVARQRESIRAIGELGPPAADIIPELVPLLMDQQLQASIVLAVAKIGVTSKQASEALVALFAEAQPQMLASLDWAVGLLGPRAVEAIPHLKQQLHDFAGSEHRNLEIRYHADWALARVDYLGGEAVPALIGSLADEDSDVRAMASENLGYIGQAAGQAVAALERLKDDTHPIVRSRAGWALQRIQGR
jgi:HEAT repeat protein